MSRLPDSQDLTRIFSVSIRQEQDVVAARQRARQIAELLDFSQQDQTRIATAVSEIVRNAYQYAGGGRLDFTIDLHSRPQFLWMHVSDTGGGIGDLDAALAGAYVSATGLGLGLAGSSRLMDEFHVASTAHGSVVRFGKAVPLRARPFDMPEIAQFCSWLAKRRDAGIAEELERQNREILQTLELLRTREAELERREQDLSRLNVELEETNRGVVALYAELDEKAVALRHAAEMKSRFLSHASHEFRTPVNSILALARMLLERKDGDLAAEQEKQVSFIRDAAQQLADLVNDLLDLAKVESGKTEIQLTSINVSQFFGAIRAIMRPLATQDAVALVFDEPPAGLMIESDEGKVAQIVRNLISNALKFTQAGEVRVSAVVNESSDSVVFQVKDTGIGIHPSDQERIFQEFAQIQHPLQKQVKGTGLGLPLSRSLAVLLGGSLTVQSSPGAGSTFTLTLPYKGEWSTDVASDGTNAVDTASKSILVIDDDVASRYLIHQLFRGSHHPIIETSGADAAERARFEDPAVIFLDLMMPDRGGLEILNELKSDERTKHIPVVIHTSQLLSQSDCERLDGRQIAILPKSVDGRLEALTAIRAYLQEPDLFSGEPEFQLNIIEDGRK
ncbi:MAG TPA: ATP-binding protein [Bryobacteraceae bacterium]|jgi:signal transduction histidine kinase|nr:ATP-binding protein [Bryobacteraceae bacterium]